MFLLDKFKPESKSEEFVKVLTKVSRELDCDAGLLLMIMYFESRLNPKARNLKRGGAGLLLIPDPDCRKIGTSANKMVQMDAVEQLVYIQKYLRPHRGRFKTLADTWYACYFPDALGRGERFWFRLPLKYREANRVFPTRSLNRVSKFEVEKALIDYFMRMGWRG